jgi:hypothetical protein
VKLGLRIVALGILAASPAAAAEPSSAPTQAAAKEPRTPSRAEQIRAAAPIKNFRLPTFTAEGFREFMLRAGEAIIPTPDQIKVRDMELTVFTRTAEEQIDVMLAAPSASFFPKDQTVRGDETVRLERSDLTVTGAGWSYDHKAQKLTITRDAHIILHAPIGDVIK